MWSGMASADQIERAIRLAADDAPELEFSRELRIAAELRGARPKPKPAAPPPDVLPDPGTDVLVIGDSHAGPHQSLRRYRWLGRFCADLQPAVIVDIGDWWSMESLSSFEKPGSLRFEGRRYWEDIDAGVAAQEVFRSAMDKAKSYKPRLIRTLGNHEHRVTKAGEADARFLELFTLDDLRSATYGWEQFPFLRAAEIGGVHFAHYFNSPGTSKPVSGTGANPPRLLFQKWKVAAVWGHSHVYSHWIEAVYGGGFRHIANAGCFFEHDEPWAGEDNRRWNRGLLYLRNVRDGSFDPEWWSMERLRREYGP